MTIGSSAIGSRAIGGDPSVASFTEAGQSCGGGIQPAPCCCCREFTEDFSGTLSDWIQEAGAWEIASGKLQTEDANAWIYTEPFGQAIDCAAWKVTAAIGSTTSPAAGDAWRVWVGEDGNRIIAEVAILNVSTPQFWCRILRETEDSEEAIGEVLATNVAIPTSLTLCVAKFDDVWMAKTLGVSVEVDEPVRTSAAGVGTGTATTTLTFDDFAAYIKASDNDSPCGCEDMPLDGGDPCCPDADPPCWLVSLPDHEEICLGGEWVLSTRWHSHAIGYSPYERLDYSQDWCAFKGLRPDGLAHGPGLHFGRTASGRYIAQMFFTVRVAPYGVTVYFYLEADEEFACNAPIVLPAQIAYYEPSATTPPGGPYAPVAISLADYAVTVTPMGAYCRTLCNVPFCADGHDAESFLLAIPSDSTLCSGAIADEVYSLEREYIGTEICRYKYTGIIDGDDTLEFVLQERRETLIAEGTLQSQPHARIDWIIRNQSSSGWRCRGTLVILLDTCSHCDDWNAKEVFGNSPSLALEHWPVVATITAVPYDTE